VSGSVSGSVIVAALRSPIGTAGHGLAGVDAATLAAPVLRAVADAVAVGGVTGRIDEVVLGNCMGPGGDVARVAALAGGLGIEVPALTVDRQCGSGLAALEVGAGLVAAGAGLVLAGGVESASTAPWRMWPPVEGETPRRYQRAPFAPTGFDDPDMGLAADLLAEESGVTRERQDAYAARSHRLAWAARERGGYDAEIVPVAGLVHDERPRPGLSEDRLARLPATFRPGGTVTAGNSCGISDGAAVVAMVPAGVQAAAGLPGLRVLATASAGVAPERPGRGMVPAVREALARAGLTLDDLDAIELNEAFAGQVLACCDELGLDPERVCTDGGALALGHPWGASGAVLAVRLFTRLVRERRGRRGLAAIAVGGGQGVAMVVEAVA
jgi:acetyl-CoA C-acetyltransferase